VATRDPTDADLPLPPAEYMKLVCGDVPDVEEAFEDVGRRLAQRLAKLEMLEPGARLLDIGCGCGRVARRLLDSPIALYTGFDRHRGMIEWAQSYIGGPDDRFRFAQVTFPYDDGTFTGALAASVFTHIDFAATNHYLSETARILAPGGRALASFFPGDTTRSMAGSSWNFVIAENDLRRVIEQTGLTLFLPEQPPEAQNWFLLGRP
jgi:cyclopropane fatty-acyl-phospholipid synthase-like methyltransferase